MQSMSVRHHRRVTIHVRRMVAPALTTCVAEAGIVCPVLFAMRLTNNRAKLCNEKSLLTYTITFQAAIRVVTSLVAVQIWVLRWCAPDAAVRLRGCLPFTY